MNAERRGGGLRLSECNQPLRTPLFVSFHHENNPSATDLVLFVAAIEERRATEELVHDAAERPDVNLLVVRTTENHLRRAVETALDVLVHLTERADPGTCEREGAKRETRATPRYKERQGLLLDTPKIRWRVRVPFVRHDKNCQNR